MYFVLLYNDLYTLFLTFMLCVDIKYIYNIGKFKNIHNQEFPIYIYPCIHTYLLKHKLTTFEYYVSVLEKGKGFPSNNLFNITVICLCAKEYYMYLYIYMCVCINMYIFRKQHSRIYYTIFLYKWYV